jgi:hypothetical protein
LNTSSLTLSFLIIFLFRCPSLPLETICEDGPYLRSALVICGLWENSDASTALEIALPFCARGAKAVDSRNRRLGDDAG